jgi:predicted acetyltransferase
MLDPTHRLSRRPALQVRDGGPNMKKIGLELRPLRVEDERSFKRAVEEFADQTPPWEFAFHFDPSGDFSEYVRKLDAWSRDFEIREGFVPSSYCVGVVEGAIIDRVSIRHELNEFLVSNCTN